MRVGVTGHQRLADLSAWSWVRLEIDRVLAELPGPLVGLTSLAAGTDQIFAEAILEHGGTLRAIVPFHDYEEKIEPGQDRDRYNRLLKHASRVEILTKVGSSREAYFQAGKQVVHMSELLVAVWDGLPAAGLGGTGDAILYAQKSSKPIIHINPVIRDVKRIHAVGQITQS